MAAGALTRRWAPQTRYRLFRNTPTIKKEKFEFCGIIFYTVICSSVWNIVKQLINGLSLPSLVHFTLKNLMWQIGFN